MPRIADYVVVRDSTLTISVPGDPDQQVNGVNLEAGAHLPSSSILSFLVTAQPGANSPQLRVRVNGSQQLNGTLPDGPFVTALQEVINANVLVAAGNSFEFALVGGSGTLNISDVVLHYQRDIP